MLDRPLLPAFALGDLAPDALVQGVQPFAMPLVPRVGIRGDRLAPDGGRDRSLAATFQEGDPVQDGTIECRKFCGGRSGGHHARSIRGRLRTLDSEVVPEVLIQWDHQAVMQGSDGTGRMGG